VAELQRAPDRAAAAVPGRRPLRVNYSLARTTANSTGGTSQSRFEPYLDNNRPELDSGRSAYNITHIINANFIFDLPFGKGRRWLDKGGVVDAVLGGWQLSGIVNWQSGSPLGIYSTRGTFNRANRSTVNSASPRSRSRKSASRSASSRRRTEHLPIDPKVIGTDGRAVGADNLNNTAGFDGQVFFNPVAGQVGTLPILAFDAPNVWQVNAALSKRFRTWGRSSLEFRVEAFNLTNSVSFYTGDFNINSTTSVGSALRWARASYSGRPRGLLIGP
jgi:hypothetical protein